MDCSPPCRASIREGSRSGGGIVAGGRNGRRDDDDDDDDDDDECDEYRDGGKAEEWAWQAYTHDRDDGDENDDDDVE